MDFIVQKKLSLLIIVMFFMMILSDVTYSHCPTCHAAPIVTISAPSSVPIQYPDEYIDVNVSGSATIDKQGFPDYYITGWTWDVNGMSQADTQDAILRLQLGRNDITLTACDDIQKRCLQRRR